VKIAGFIASHTAGAADENGICPGETPAQERSSGMTAIPELPDGPNAQGQTVTIDATGTQTGTAAKIRSKKAEDALG
jgi:hypothetical protein